MSTSTALVLTVRTLEEAIEGLPAQRQFEWRWAPKALANIFAVLRQPGWDAATLQRATHDFCSIYFRLDLSVIFGRLDEVMAALDTSEARLNLVEDPVAKAVARWLMAAIRPFLGKLNEVGPAELEQLAKVTDEELAKIGEPAGALLRGYVLACTVCDAIEREEFEHLAFLCRATFSQLIAGWSDELPPPFEGESRPARRARFLEYVRLVRDTTGDQQTIVLQLASVHLGIPRPQNNLFGMPGFEHLEDALTELTRDDGPLLSGVLVWLHEAALTYSENLRVACTHARALALAGRAADAEVAAFRALALSAAANFSHLDLAEVLVHAGVVDEAKRALLGARDLEASAEWRARFERLATNLAVRFGQLEWLDEVVPNSAVRVLLGDATAWTRRQTVVEGALEGLVAMVEVETERLATEPHLFLSYYTSSTSWSAVEQLIEKVFVALQRHDADAGRTWKAVVVEVHGPYVPPEGMAP